MDAIKRAAIERLSIQYLEEGYGGHLLVVCTPGASLGKPEVKQALVAIGSLEGVTRVLDTHSQSADMILHVELERSGDVDLKRELLELLNPTCVLGRAKIKVVRSESGKHITTCLYISVSEWAAQRVAKLWKPLVTTDGEVSQVAMLEAFRDDYNLVDFSFTMKRPSRDIELNRDTIQRLARMLCVDIRRKIHFEDSPVWSAVKACNLEDDPIDDRP